MGSESEFGAPTEQGIKALGWALGTGPPEMEQGAGGRFQGGKGVARSEEQQEGARWQGRGKCGTAHHPQCWAPGGCLSRRRSPSWESRCSRMEGRRGEADARVLPGGGRNITPRADTEGEGYTGAQGVGRLRACPPAPPSSPGPLSFCPHPQFSPWGSVPGPGECWPQRCDIGATCDADGAPEAEACACWATAACRSPSEAVGMSCVCLPVTFVQMSPHTQTCGG